MLIYRYENKKGRGPFTNAPKTEEEYELDEVLYSCLNMTIHPEPNWDLYPEESKKYHFGCASMEEINHWFNEDVKECLEDAGFKLKIYDCPDEYCVEDKNQIGFIMDEAEDITNSMREFVPIF